MSDVITTFAEMQPAAPKVYTKPAIIHDLELETRAGSPLVPNIGIDPLGIDPNKPKP